MPDVLFEEEATPEEIAEATICWQHVDLLNTWRFRQRSGRSGLHMANQGFNQALLACSRTWHNVLTAAQRAGWVTRSQLWQGARVLKNMPPANGWNLFAVTAFAPLYFNTGIAPPTSAGNWDTMNSLTFTKADHDNQRLYVEAQMDWPESGFPSNAIFLYQIDPLYYGRPDQNRRTLLAGYHEIPTEPVDPVTFSGEAPWSFDEGQEVRVLIRFHQAGHGVQNAVQNQDAV